MEMQTLSQASEECCLRKDKHDLNKRKNRIIYIAGLANRALWIILTSNPYWQQEYPGCQKKTDGTVFGIIVNAFKTTCSSLV